MRGILRPLIVRSKSIKDYGIISIFDRALHVGFLKVVILLERKASSSGTKAKFKCPIIVFGKIETACKEIKK